MMKIIQLLPVILLFLIAGLHALTVTRSDLSVWHLGGFGMFSRVDSGANRLLQVHAFTGAWEHIDVSGSLASSRVKTLPTRSALEAFLADLACSSELPSDATRVRLRLYRATFDSTSDRAGFALIWEGTERACA